ncbi:glycosyltransferase family 4 protein [Streptomyces sp. NPDC051940]|uniref:glycosyltransferase family 4 protein n=1 Tax=Streptomyces sp. NPDC051940 TaxID=3155675 RepID=UPI0034259775
MKIAFLLHDVYGIGGTNRTTLNLAAALADRHQVEIVSMRRHRRDPYFALDPRVSLVNLVDARKDSADARDPRSAEPSTAFPSAEIRHHQYSRLADARVEAYLRGSDADVLIGTRPGANAYLARFASPTALRIGQEHLSHDAHSPRLRGQLAPLYRRLDALVTTTEADARVYRRRMPLPGVEVLAVPNSVPKPDAAPSPGTEKVIAAAGRLARGKRYDVLVDAFAQVASRHPDWSLRIYGTGPERAALQARIDGLGLTDSARLMGVATPIEPEFAKASVVAVSSEAESFGMTIVEAMSCGVPVVSADCPLGPGEIIDDGVDGRLFPVGDATALAAALTALIEDEPSRHAMAAAALRKAARFTPETIVPRYDDLFARLAATRAERARARGRGAAAAWVRESSVRLRSGARRTAGRVVRGVRGPAG